MDLFNFVIAFTDGGVRGSLDEEFCFEVIVTSHNQSLWLHLPRNINFFLLNSMSFFFN